MDETEMKQILLDAKAESGKTWAEPSGSSGSLGDSCGERGAEVETTAMKVEREAHAPERAAPGASALHTFDDRVYALGIRISRSRELRLIVPSKQIPRDLVRREGRDAAVGDSSEA